MFIETGGARRIEQTADPERGVEHQASDVGDERTHLTLQQVIDDDDRILEVVEEVVHPGLHRLRQMAVTLRHRLENGAVECVIEFVGSAVHPLPWITRVALHPRRERGAAAQQQQVNQQQVTTYFRSHKERKPRKVAAL